MSKIKELLIRHEGLKFKPYLCTSGKLTIGVGRNLDSKGITKEEALYLLENDIEETKKYLETFAFWSRLNDARKDALIDFCFNVGFGTFVKFKKMILALEYSDYKKASEELLDSKYAQQVGKRAYELAYMIETGLHIPEVL